MADEIESQITVAGAANDPEARQVAIEVRDCATYPTLKRLDSGAEHS